MRTKLGMRVGIWLVLACAAAGVAPQAAAAWNGPPSFGPNVIVFTPSMPQSQIQATLDSISDQQVSNQFGSQRYAILFEPGTYGSAASPLVFQVGYYTAVAGLGLRPGDVTINGAIEVFNGSDGTGLTNFWRSVSNLTLNVTLPSSPPNYAPPPPESPSCANQQEFWAVSQAAPMRRVIVNGNVFLFDYCNTGFVSGGFLSDDEFQNGAVINGSQQQFFTRNSTIDSWTNSVWNQVFLGDNGSVPQTSFGPSPVTPPPNPPNPQYTTLPSTPVSQSEPFLYTDSGGNYNVFVPAVQRDAVGPSYAAGATEAGSSISIRRFFIANPNTPVWAINAALAFGQNLILTPGVYNLREPIVVSRPGTVVIGLGFATLIPQDGNAAMETADVPGIKLSGMIFDAGPRTSYALLEVGAGREHFGHGFGGRAWSGGASDPTLVQDVFLRVGGAATTPVHTDNALVVNTDNTILDDVWAWRADHGNDVGWTTNTADTGLVVNGDDVEAYGLFVEHFQKFEVIWNGRDGEDVFFQNEMPYDPPSQAAWMSSPSTDGYAAFLVTPRAKGFQGWGMGSYSFFNQGVSIFAAQAFQSPASGVAFHDIFTIFLNASASGGINSVINGTGGPSNGSNPDTPIDVASYP
jgi:hypothetical protein